MVANPSSAACGVVDSALLALAAPRARESEALSGEELAPRFPARKDAIARSQVHIH
jgi:hypothetical protein